MRNQSSENIHKPTLKVAYSPPHDYLRIILARKWIILPIFFASLGASFLYLKTVTPVYRAQVIIMREETENLPASIIEIEPFTPRESLQSHIELLRSSSSVVEIKELLKNKYQLEFTLPQIIGHFSLVYGEDNSILKLTATAYTPEGAQALANAVAEIHIEKVAEIKSAYLDKGLSFLEQQIESVDKNLLQSEEALNEFREKEGIWALPQTTSSGSIPTYPSSSGGLLTKLGEIQTELSKTETDIEWVSARLQSVQTLLSEKWESSLSYSISLSPQIDDIRTKLVELHLQLFSLSEQFTEKDPQVITLTRQIDALQKRLDAELAKLKAGGGTSLDALSELQSLVQQSISLKVQKRDFEQKAAILKEKIARFKEEHPKLTAKQVELTRLERQSRVREQNYAMLLDKHEEMLLLKGMKTSGLRILDKAALPQSPIAPKKKRTLLYGFIIGLVLAIGTAFFLEYIDDSVKLREDIERYLGLPVIGTIPKIPPFKVPENALSRRELSTDSLSTDYGNGLNGLRSGNSEQGDLIEDAANQPTGLPSNAVKGANLVSPGQSGDGFTGVNPGDVQSKRRQRHAKGHRKRIKHLLSSIILYAEKRTPILTNYRTLAANIRYANVDTPTQTLLVTSAAPMEGKTATATNLAISMAQTGNKVLLIDTDLRRPRMHRIFQQDPSPGLTELLTDETHTIEEDSRIEEPFIRPTSIDNLYLFPCGAHVSNPEGLLSSEKMKRLIKSLSAQYDIILFDSPPLISAADAMILATEVDATLLVVHSGKTKRQIALQGKELLENVDANIIGAVLNNIDYSKQYGSYYYYYYYYRSYYYSSDEDEN